MARVMARLAVVPPDARLARLVRRRWCRCGWWPATSGSAVISGMVHMTMVYIPDTGRPAQVRESG